MTPEPEPTPGGDPDPRDAARQKLVLKLVIVGCLLANAVVLLIVVLGKSGK
jgi:hypothetical protein